LGSCWGSAEPPSSECSAFAEVAVAEPELVLAEVVSQEDFAVLPLTLVAVLGLLAHWQLLLLVEYFLQQPAVEPVLLQPAEQLVLQQLAVEEGLLQLGGHLQLVAVEVQLLQLEGHFVLQQVAAEVQLLLVEEFSRLQPLAVVVGLLLLGDSLAIVLPGGTLLQ